MVGVNASLDDSLTVMSETIKQKELLPPKQTDELSNLLSVSMQGLNLHPAHPNAVVLLTGEASKKARTLAKVIARSIFAKEERVISIDFGALKEPHELSRLIGTGPGLISFGNKAPIHEIAQMPWSVLVCEGIEACHPVIRDVLSKALANGYMTDGKGKKIYLSDTIVILTAGTLNLSTRKMGFGRGRFSARAKFKSR